MTSSSSAKLCIITMANVNGVSGQPHPGWPTWLWPTLANLASLAGQVVFVKGKHVKQSQIMLWSVQIPNSPLSVIQNHAHYRRIFTIDLEISLNKHQIIQIIRKCVIMQRVNFGERYFC